MNETVRAIQSESRSNLKNRLTENRWIKPMYTLGRSGIKQIHRKPWNWPLVRACISYWFWQFLTKVILSGIYLTLIADGATQFIPPLGTRLYKAFAFLSFLQDYEATYRTTLAQPASLLFMIFVWIAWRKALNQWLPDEPVAEQEQTESKRARDVMTVLAVILLIGDCCLFYLSLVRVTWGGTTFSASALLGTVVYAALLVFAVQHSRSLHRKCVLLENKKESQK
jgi:hypothetical protein